MKKQREAGQVIDDDKERSGNGTKSDDPHKRDDKINRKREDDEEIISEMRTDFHMKTHAICVLTARCVSAFSSMFAYASGDPTHALSSDEAEDIISQTICSMRATTATPSTSNNPAGAIQAPRPPWANQASQFASASSIKNASILPYASGDSSRALSTDKDEEIISQTITSMMATTASPSTSNNPAGAIQAPPPPPRRMNQASIIAYASADSSRALSTDEAEDIISQTISSMTAITTTPSTSNNTASAIQAPHRPWKNQPSIVASTSSIKNASILPYSSADSSRALSTDEAEDIISQTISSMTATTATPPTSNNPAGAIQAPAAPPLTAQALSKLNSLVTEIFKGACKILGDVIRTYGVSCDIPKQHNNALFIMDDSSPFNNDFPL